MEVESGAAARTALIAVAVTSLEVISVHAVLGGSPDLDAGIVLDVGDGAGERVAVERIAVKRL